MKGPAIFLAQFIRYEAPFNSLDGLCAWAAGHGFTGIQMPTLDAWLIDLKKAAESKTYCDELTGKVKSHGLEITELSTHLQGQLVPYTRLTICFIFAPRITRRTGANQVNLRKRSRLGLMRMFCTEILAPY
jgi:hypothetical protein